ncbi:Rad4 domain-containing protein [Neurospora intermedia]|uniref:Rad4 domain-containing protein n=1 Tax=Neurospora intermedia TaxID=5142 RepID=A0ABR3D9Y9_NEUIN
MATEHERYIDDYESGVRSGRIAQPPRGLMKFIDKIYEIQNHTCILPARLKELRVATPATASREEAQRIFDQFIDPLGESLRYLLDIVQTAYVDFHFARLRARRSGSPPAVLRSLDNLEALWREAIEEAEDVLDAARDDLKYHFAAYGVPGRYLDHPAKDDWLFREVGPLDTCPTDREISGKTILKRRKRKAPSASTTTSTPRTTRASTASRRAASARSAVPDVYREMVSEARRMSVAEDVPEATTPERPLKRRRPGERQPPKVETKPVKSTVIPESITTDHDDPEDDDDEELEFEDVELPPPTLQTITRDSDDEDDEELELEDIAFDSQGAFSSAVAGDVQLDLNLSAQKAAMAPHRRVVERRKALSKSEKEQRREIHKIHLLCLLAHVERRNRWCNSPKVQEALRPLLTDKMRKSLIPRASLNQYGRTESLKAGLQETSTMFKTKFQITERGLRRALWVEDEEQLKNYQLPDDLETVKSKDDFLKAAKSLSGSRDVGAQLFCALLRSIGVQARLVCSLQPLSCVPGAPTMPKQQKTKSLNASKGPSAADRYAAAMSKYDNTVVTPDPRTPAFLSGRSRLGHPNATAYNVPSMTAPPPPPSRPEIPKAKTIKGESPYPIYWVEVLDEAQQKWHPVDPLVTNTQWRPRALEPPASDKENSLTYAIAFDEDGFARDVTRRYAKAYNSKTKRQRIDGPISPTTPSGINTGERWLRRLFLRHYTASDFPTDLDQIELNELAALEGAEPMPRNVQDFKDHPIYALERHLRRNEVLLPGAQSTGTVSAGSKAPVERIYRRKDVVVARSRDKWFRLGRVVKPGEEPVKVLPPKRKRSSKFGGERISSPPSLETDNEEDEGDLFGDYSLAKAGGTPLYTPQQTDLYVPPPVSKSGKIPKNKFGNVEVYVPSMVPAGGAHVPHERAAQAAHILGVDYAPALTGFEWKGRKGTARILGVVVPEKAAEAVRAVITGLVDMEEEEREERRRMEVLRMWRVMLRGMRIRERVFGGVGEEEEVEEGEGEEHDKKKDKKGKETEEEQFDREMADAPSDVSEEFYMDMDNDDEGGGGGFLVE